MRVRNNHVFNRAITWLRERISPNPMRHAATDAARNRFLQAIAHRQSGYDGADLNRARDLLADDALARRQLSSRRIREVLNDLDGRSDPTTRVNRRVASYYREQTGISNTLAARDLAAGARIRPADDVLSLYAEEAVAAPPDDVAGEPGDPVPVAATGPARAGVTAEAPTDPSDPSPATSTEGASAPDSFADPAPPTTRAETTAEPATLAAPSPTTTTEAPAAAGTDEATLPPSHAEGAARPPAASVAGGGTTAPGGVPPRLLTRELSRAKLPPEIAKPLRKLIASRGILDADGLAKHGNRRMAGWVEEFRVGKWYVEALKDKATRRMAERGGVVHVPTPLLNKVARSITDSPVLKKYPDIKRDARVLVAAHVQQETERGTVSQEAVIHGAPGPEEPARRARGT